MELTEYKAYVDYMERQAFKPASFKHWKKFIQADKNLSVLWDKVA